MGRLRILSADRISDTRRCVMIMMVIEGVLETGASIEFESHYLRVLAMAKPSYRRQQPEMINPEDLLEVAREGETIESIVDASLLDFPLTDMLYHDFNFT